MPLKSLLHNLLHAHLRYPSQPISQPSPGLFAYFVVAGPSELFRTNFQSHSFLFNVTLLSLSTVVCSYILRVFYRAEVVAGKKHGLQVEIYAMKAALSFVCNSLGICCSGRNPSGPPPSSSVAASSSFAANPARGMDEDDIEAGIPLMEQQ